MGYGQRWGVRSRGQRAVGGSGRGWVVGVEEAPDPGFRISDPGRRFGPVLGGGRDDCSHSRPRFPAPVPGPGLSRTAGCRLPRAGSGCRLPAADYRLPIAVCCLPVGPSRGTWSAEVCQFWQKCHTFPTHLPPRLPFVLPPALPSLEAGCLSNWSKGVMVVRSDPGFQYPPPGGSR